MTVCVGCSVPQAESSPINSTCQQAKVAVRSPITSKLASLCCCTTSRGAQALLHAVHVVHQRPRVCAVRNVDKALRRQLPGALLAQAEGAGDHLVLLAGLHSTAQHDTSAATTHGTHQPEPACSALTSTTVVYTGSMSELASMAGRS